MRRLKIGMIDPSAAIRGVLRRELESSGLEVVVWPGGNPPVAAVAELDAILVGRGADTRDDTDELLEAVRSLRIPVVILHPPGQGSGCGPGLVDDDAQIIFEKPRTPDGWRTLGREVAQKIRTLVPRAGERTETGTQRPIDLIVVGGSAGGPDATAAMLTEIGPVLEGAAVVIVQHLSTAFEPSYIAWLQESVPWAHVAVATEAEWVRAGTIRIAPHGVHLLIRPDRKFALDPEGPPVNGHRPSVDRLFRSVVDQDPRRTAAVLLSGMGRDGADGLAVLQEHRFLTLVQDRSSSAVFGMPRAAAERGVGLYMDSPSGIGRILKNRIKNGQGS